MIILSSPSGAGKTTLVKLLSERKGFITSISHTTRTPRSNEVDGKDYYFVNIEKFEKMIDRKEFLEYAKVFKNFYGTTKLTIFEELKKATMLYLILIGRVQIKLYLKNLNINY